MSSTVNIVIQFYNTNGRVPNKKEPNGDFIRQCRLGQNKEHHARLDRACPGWRDPNMSEFPASLTRLVAYCTSNRRMPKSHEPEYTTLKNTRDGHHTDWWPTLDKLIPGWKDKKGPGVLTQATKIERVAKLVAFYKAHKRFPKRNEAGGNLLFDMRKGKHRELQYMLDNTTKYWRKEASSYTTDDESFEEINQALTKYIIKARNNAVSAATTEQRTITLSDGSSWTGVVKTYPTLGQGCDFDKYSH